MPSYIEFQKEIVDILSENYIFSTEDGRRSMLIHAGLDETLMSQINIQGTPFVFLTNLIENLVRYGQLTDGRDSLEVFLETVCFYSGKEKKEFIKNLVKEWQIIKQSKLAWSVQIITYLNHLINKWTYLESPLLPSDCLLSELAITLKVISIDNKPGRTAIFRSIKLKKSTINSQPSLIDNNIDLYELLNQITETQKWILFGEPGIGKTTLLLQTAARLASEALNKNTVTFIPIWFDLAPFGQQIEKSPNYSFYDYINLIGQKLLINDFGIEIQQLIRKGQVIFLLDGLDEVRDRVRDQIKNAIDVCLSIGESNRVIVTSRKVGFSGYSGYSYLEVAPMTLDNQKQIMLAICGEQKTQRLLAEISNRTELQEMASIPMMLTVLALVTRESEHLSDDYFRRHSDLFKLASRILLEGRHRKGQGVRNPYHAELVLAPISLILHGDINHDRGDEVFNADDIEHAIEIIDQKWLIDWQSPRDFIEDISVCSNIIYPIDTLKQKFRYLHRTFREFFAALELSHWDSEKRRKFVKSVVQKQSWAEILVLLGGLVSDVDEYLIFLLNGPPDLALRTLKEVKSLSPKLAAQVLELRPMHLQERKQVFINLVRKLPNAKNLVDVLWSYLKSEKETIPRVDLYFIQEILNLCNIRIAEDLLGELFKYLPKVPPDLFDFEKILGKEMEYWCSVPEGKCIIGASPDDPDKPNWVTNFIEVFISSYKIGRVPITNRIYEVFDPNHKLIRDFQEYVSPEELAYHPVVGISWYEAEMFCQWAAQTFPGVRLPTEYEWEKAASWTGEKKLKFPWGDEWSPSYLNSWEKGPNMTTQVGTYPNGASPYGVLDMAGNVWEWCLDWFTDDLNEYFNFLKINPNNPIGSPFGIRRVDRGGGWYHDVGKPCTFLRAADNPADTFSHCGFRIINSLVNHTKGYDLFKEQSIKQISTIKNKNPLKIAKGLIKTGIEL